MSGTDKTTSMSASHSMSSAADLLPESLRVIERGWLSANTVLAFDEKGITLIDSGYHTHTHFLQAALRNLAGEQRIDTVYNTHLHSDHCGGNAWLAQQYAGIRISIPGTTAQRVADWSHAEGLYAGVGQSCPKFVHTAVHADGDVLAWGGLQWRTISSPGHDNDSVMFFNEEHRILISADALWENGFGVLFPLIDGEDAFTDQTATLNLIESLQARVVIPGHGSVFTEVNKALDIARERIASFMQKPERAMHNAFRVLMKFNLLEWQRLEWNDYRQRYAGFQAIQVLAAKVLPPQTDLADFADKVASALVAAGAAKWERGWLVNQ